MTPKAITTAILMALGAMVAMPAAAVQGCNPYYADNEVSSTMTVTCYLSSGSSLAVTDPDGLISVVNGPGVSVGNINYPIDSPVSLINNNGGISSTGTAATIGFPSTPGGAGTGIRIANGVSRTGASHIGVVNIANTGTISGTGGAGSAGMMPIIGPTAGGNGSGVSIDSSIVGTITNSGAITGTGGTGGSMGFGLPAISGVGSGVNIVKSTVGAIVNDGTISGASGASLFWFPGMIDGSVGINVADSTSEIHGGSTVDSIVNNGTISGGTAINIDPLSTVTHGITNTGALKGAVNLNGATLNLNGNTATVTGPVSGGKGSIVNVNGSFTSASTFNVSSLNVAAEALFNMGHDVTVASGLQNAGTLSVAAGTTATIHGDYTQAAGGVFETGLSSAETYGKLAVTGTADLSASNRINVNIVDAPVLIAGTSVQPNVISAATLIAGPAFTVTDNSALFDFIAARNGNAVDLCVARAGAADCAEPTPKPTPEPEPEPEPTPMPMPTPEPVPMLTPAPRITVLSSVTSANNNPGFGAAGVFDRLIDQRAALPAAMVPVITALGRLPTEQAVSDAVSQTLPLMSAGMSQINSATMHGTNRVIQARQEANKGLSSGGGFIGDRQIWLKPVGSWADQDDRNGVPGYKADTYGILFGMDRVISDKVRVGGAFSYMHSTVDGNSSVAQQQAKVDGYRVIGYGSYSLDAQTDLSFQADIGHGSNEGKRVINFGGLNSVARSSYNSWSAHLGVGLGRTLPLSAKTSFTPSVRADYTYLQDNAYRETGADALNLDVAKNSVKELILSTDGKLHHALTDRTTLSANLGAGYDTLSEQSSITAAFVGGGSQFATRGLNPSPWLMRAGLGMTVNTGGAMEITTRYDAEARKSFTNHSVSVKLRMPF